MKFIFESKTINYISKGKGELLIILPGNTASSIVYQSQVDFFSKHFLTISVDFLGTGKSDRIFEIKENWWKFSSRQVKALIEHLGYKKATVIGSSGGAAVAMFLAADFPDKVNMLILESFSLRLTEEMLTNNIINERKNPNELQIQFWKYCHGEDWDKVIEYDTENIKYLVKNGGDWIADSYKKIMCPVLLLGSMEDEFNPNIEHDYKQLSKEIKNCSWVLSEKGEHPLIWTNTDFFNKELLKFMADRQIK